MGLHLGMNQDIPDPKTEWTKGFTFKSSDFSLGVEFELSISVFS
jgi:hypothetical protein